MIKNISYPFINALKYLFDFILDKQLVILFRMINKIFINLALSLKKCLLKKLFS